MDCQFVEHLQSAPISVLTKDRTTLVLFFSSIVSHPLSVSTSSHSLPVGWNNDKHFYCIVSDVITYQEGDLISSCLSNEPSTSQKHKFAFKLRRLTRHSAYQLRCIAEDSQRNDFHFVMFHTKRLHTSSINQ